MVHLVQLEEMIQIPIVITLLARKNLSNVQFVKQLLQPKTPWKHILIQFMMEKSWMPHVLSVQFVKKYSHLAVIFGLTFQTSTKMWWLKVAKSQKFFSIFVLKVSWIQNKFMRSSFLPKFQPKIPNISALPSNKLPGQKSIFRETMTS